MGYSGFDEVRVSMYGGREMIYELEASVWGCWNLEETF